MENALDPGNIEFSKKFWNKLQFSDEQEIDIKIKDFNVAYEKYSQLISNNAMNRRLTSRSRILTSLMRNIRS
jgi:hypothetical protein